MDTHFDGGNLSVMQGMKIVPWTAARSGRSSASLASIRQRLGLSMAASIRSADQLASLPASGCHLLLPPRLFSLAPAFALFSSFLDRLFRGVRLFLGRRGLRSPRTAANHEPGEADHQ